MGDRGSRIILAGVASAVSLAVLAIALHYWLIADLRANLLGNLNGQLFSADRLTEAVDFALIKALAAAGLVSVGVAGCIALLVTKFRRELGRSQRELQRLNQIDCLTGLNNRSVLAGHIERCIARSCSAGSAVVVACIDIDRFQTINEQFGLAEGDQLLKAFAGRLRDAVRKSDLVARIGNNGFAIVFDDVEAGADLTLILNRLRQNLQAPFSLNGQELTISVCAGLSRATDPGFAAGTLLKQAETALHKAKLSGRGSIEIFAAEMDGEAQGNLVLEAELRRAIEANAITLFYQPQIDVVNGTVTGCEALIRWDNARFGKVSPTRFIPIAEESGLIHELTDYILRRACLDAKEWPMPIPVAVNLSALEFAARNVPRLIADVLCTTGLPPCRLELEVTEGILMKKSEATLHAFRDLREMEVGVAIDDFGTGYSSLSYLANFPFTKLKIDRAFVVASGQFKNMTSIIRAIVGLGKSLGVQVIVEGVETATQLQRMKRAGCRYVQGYYFSHPLSQADLIDYLAESQRSPEYRAEVRVASAT